MKQLPKCFTARSSNNNPPDSDSISRRMHCGLILLMQRFNVLCPAVVDGGHLLRHGPQLPQLLGSEEHATRCPSGVTHAQPRPGAVVLPTVRPSGLSRSFSWLRSCSRSSPRRLRRRSPKRLVAVRGRGSSRCLGDHPHPMKNSTGSSTMLNPYGALAVGYPETWWFFHLSSLNFSCSSRRATGGGDQIAQHSAECFEATQWKRHVILHKHMHTYIYIDTHTCLESMASILSQLLAPSNRKTRPCYPQILASCFAAIHRRAPHPAGNDPPKRENRYWSGEN